MVGLGWVWLVLFGCCAVIWCCGFWGGLFLCRFGRVRLPCPVLVGVCCRVVVLALSGSHMRGTY